MDNHEINGYKRLKGQVITVVWNIITKDGNKHTEYIQGVLRTVDDNGIEIEQYLTLFDYLDGANPPSVIRRFGYREINFLGRLPG